MKIGQKVQLLRPMQLTPVGVSTPRGADLRTFDKGSEFTLVNIEGENGIIKDSDGNFWSVLIGFLGLVTEAATFDGNTTVNEGLNWFGRAIAWIGSIKFKNPFKKKK